MIRRWTTLLLLLSPLCHKAEGGKALPSVPPVAPPMSKTCTESTIPSKSHPLGVGDWLTDKDISC